MHENGCKVDFDKMVVKTPEHVLRKCLATAPSRFTLHARKPEYDVRVDQNNVYTIGGSSALFVLGLDGVRRPATLKDLEDLMRLEDSLENLHIMHAIVNPQDIPQEAFDRILFATAMKHTSRNYYSQALGKQAVRDQIEMAKVISGSLEEFQKRPFFTMVLCMISPLVQPRIRVEELMECAKFGIPIYVEVDAMPGATTPITTAGTLVEQCANVLTGVCLAQMIRPGLPCTFAIASGIMDMSTMNYSGGAPETQILHGATAQMAHYYNLPCQAGTGIEATQSDAQAGYERALQVLTCALSGVDFIHLSIGMMEQMLLTSFEQCVIDDEIIGAAFRIVKGFEVNKETIALDLIKKIGIAGNYLSEEHTVNHFREVSWFPKITNRSQWENWMAAGGKDMQAVAKEKAKKILDEYHPVNVEPKQAEEIDKMAKAFQIQEIEAVRTGKIEY
jgi:trimethylamine--corrinoid protein Co-methyltransferase